jgi:uncharacterized protein YjbJ (UPF0337 family)
MNDDVKNKFEGKVDEVQGRAKSAVGNVTGDDELKGEGELDQMKGKLKQGFADAKDKIGDMVDRVTDGDDDKK